MLEKQFNDVHNALDELAKSMCIEVNNHCNDCPFNVYTYNVGWGCFIKKAKVNIYKAEERVKIREYHKKNNFNL